MLLLTPAGEIHVKGSWTRRMFHRALLDNVRAALRGEVPDAAVGALWWNRLTVETTREDEAAAAAARVFGIQRVDAVDALEFTSLRDLTARAARLIEPRVAGKVFALRLKRRGQHSWTSMDAMSAIGAAVYDDSAGVDLADPEVEVRIEVAGDRGYVVRRSWPAADGLPLGTQARSLALLSGGFDSPVAAWLMMRRGCPVDLVHFKLDCAQSDHAAAVGLELWQRWGHGSTTTLHVVDFQDAKERLKGEVEARVRQVVLKQLMVEAAGLLSEELGIDALVTGESVGQVSSQTLVNLAAIDRSTSAPVLRPLLGMTKQEIMDKARHIGTYELSARAREVCDLSEGRPVAVAATFPELDAARFSLPADLVSSALAAREAVDIAEWAPGMELPRAG